MHCHGLCLLKRTRTTCGERVRLERAGEVHVKWFSHKSITPRNRSSSFYPATNWNKTSTASTHHYQSCLLPRVRDMQERKAFGAVCITCQRIGFWGCGCCVLFCCLACWFPLDSCSLLCLMGYVQCVMSLSTDAWQSGLMKRIARKCCCIGMTKFKRWRKSWTRCLLSIGKLDNKIWNTVYCITLLKNLIYFEVLKR